MAAIKTTLASGHTEVQCRLGQVYRTLRTPSTASSVQQIAFHLYGAVIAIITNCQLLGLGVMRAIQVTRHTGSGEQVVVVRLIVANQANRVSL